MDNTRLTLPVTDTSFCPWRRLWLTLLATLLCVNVQTSTGCLNYTQRWSSGTSKDSISIYCNEISDCLWWQGSNVCDTTTFHRYTECPDGAAVCSVDYSSLIQEESESYFCCSRSGLNDLSGASLLERYCFQVAICPEVEISTPPVVFTDSWESAYVKVITKPYLATPPSLMIDLLGTQISLNSTVFTVPPLADEPMFQTVYTYRFHLTRQQFREGHAHLRFTPNNSEIPDISQCPLVRGESKYVRMIDSGETVITTMEPTMETSPSTTTTTEVFSPTSDSSTLDKEVCIGVPVGATAIIVVFFIGMIIPLIIWKVRKFRSNRTYSSVKRSSQAVPCNFSCEGRNPPRTLPHILLDSPSSITTNTPTPTEDRRLLEGQTPLGYPTLLEYPTPLEFPTLPMRPTHPNYISPYAVTPAQTPEVVGVNRLVPTPGFPGDPNVEHRTIVLSTGETSGCRDVDVGSGQSSDQRPNTEGLYHRAGEHIILPPDRESDAMVHS